MFCGCRAGVRTDVMHTRATSVDSMVCIVKYIFSSIPVADPIAEACGVLKVLDMLIALSRSLYQDLKDHVAPGKCA